MCAEFVFQRERGRSLLAARADIGEMAQRYSAHGRNRQHGRAKRLLDLHRKTLGKPVIAAVNGFCASVVAVKLSMAATISNRRGTDNEMRPSPNEDRVMPGYGDAAWASQVDRRPGHGEGPHSFSGRKSRTRKKPIALAC